MSELKIEKQVGTLCGLHALNNIFQRTNVRFYSSRTKNPTVDPCVGYNWIDVDEAVDIINGRLKCILDETFLTQGNYNVDCLCQAVTMAGFGYQFVEKKCIKRHIQIGLHPCLGVLGHVHHNNRDGHWIAIMKQYGDIFVLDSLTPSPIPFDSWFSANGDSLDSFIYLGGEFSMSS